MSDITTLHILLADDDKDDCLFFEEALDELRVQAELTIVHDGEKLMHLFAKKAVGLFHVLFLDLNMPRKNGFECLMEIRNNPLLKTIPVIIYSTSYSEEIANQLYDKGANYYICKPPDYEDLKKVVYLALSLVKENKLRPSKENFLINKLKTALR